VRIRQIASAAGLATSVLVGAASAAPYPEKGAMIGAFTFEADGKFPTNGEAGITAFEALIGRKLASVMWYVTWDDPFPAAACEIVRKHDAIPHVTWELFRPSQNANNTRAVASPAETGLDDVLAGKYDDYIDRFARDAKAWGGPVLIRFLHEFNGNWYVWGGLKNGAANGGPEKVKKVWQYVVRRFRAVGATNVLWMWCAHGPTIDVPKEPWNEVSAYWPGADFVDWFSIDGYNWYPKDPWGNVRPYQDFDTAFKDTYDKLLALAHKPISIGEFASGEFTKDEKNKATWIRETFRKIKTDYPWIKLITWFQIKKELDWRVNSSPEALAAFKEALADPYYLSDPPRDTP
jgi:beta-mannanase